MQGEITARCDFAVKVRGCAGVVEMTRSAPMAQFCLIHVTRLLLLSSMVALAIIT